MNKNIYLIIDNENEKEKQAKRLLKSVYNLHKSLKSKVILVTFNVDNPKDFASETRFKSILNIKTKEKISSNFDILSILKDFFKDKEFSFICFENSIKGIETGAQLAPSLNASIITGVDEIEKGPFFSRMIFNSKIKTKIKALNKKNILTINTAGFAQNSILDLPEKIEETHMDFKTSKTKILKVSKKENDSSMDNANIILSAGKGFTQEKDLEKIFELAGKIPGAYVACSRPLVDSGWMKYKRQVGITGNIVSPQIYAAFGISGSSQHIYGIKNSGTIIAVNSDASASIINNCDFFIHEDVLDFIDILIKKL